MDHLESPAGNKKICDIESLCERSAKLRSEGKTIAYCNGVFDLLHAGKIKLLQKAKGMADLLIVSLTADEYVKEGPNRPIFTESLRAEALTSLNEVDYVVINRSPNAFQMLEMLKPDIYVCTSSIGSSQEKDLNLKLEIDAIKRNGGRIEFLDDLSTQTNPIISSLFAPQSKGLLRFVNKLRTDFSLDDFKSYFEKIANLKTLVIGEPIIDEYSYCEAIGKAGKEPVLVAKGLHAERFLGGSLAIANNLASFTKSVHLHAFLGETETHQELIESGLVKGVDAHFEISKNRPTIRKKRYVENYLLQKLFEIYVIDDSPIPQDEENAFIEQLDAVIDDFDVVIVSDFGHGQVTANIVDFLTKRAKFLAVNTQCNAGNTGMHTISRYPRADYISLSQRELRMDLRTHSEDIQEMVEAVRQKIDCDRITVTKGRYGILSFWEKEGFAHAPGLTDHVVDRIGSGDAVFAITSLLAAVDTPAAILSFVGNIVGAHAVKTMGHRTSLDFGAVMKDIEAIFEIGAQESI